MKGFDLPAGVLLGCSDFAGFDSLVQHPAQDQSTIHHVLSDDDVRIIRKMRLQTYYYCLDWSSMEPEPGFFAQESLALIRKSLQQLQQAGVRVTLGLYHRGQPGWFQAAGGWTSPEAPEFFERYTEHIVHQLGDLVERWVTIDDPEMSVRDWWDAQVEKKWHTYLKTVNNLIEGHVRAYLKIHRLRKLMGKEQTQAAPLIRLLPLSASHNRLDSWAAALYQRIHQDLWLSGMLEGNRLFPLGWEKADHVPRYGDYLGIACQGTEARVFRWQKDSFFSHAIIPEGIPLDDAGLPVDVGGLYQSCRRAYQQYFLPLEILACTIADQEDTFRSRFLLEHLEAVSRLCVEGIPVMSFHYHRLFDIRQASGLKWGLVLTDINARKTTVKKSGILYQNIIRSRKVDSVTIREYLGSQPRRKS